MPYYQEIVAEYLASDRYCFVNPEFLIDIDGQGPHSKGTSWWVDVAAINFLSKEIQLCEVSYSKTLSALTTRLGAWREKWDFIRPSIYKIARVANDWNIRVRVSYLKAVRRRLPK